MGTKLFQGIPVSAIEAVVDGAKKGAIKYPSQHFKSVSHMVSIVSLFTKGEVTLVPLTPEPQSYTPNEYTVLENAAPFLGRDTYWLKSDPIIYDVFGNVQYKLINDSFVPVNNGRIFTPIRPKVEDLLNPYLGAEWEINNINSSVERPSIKPFNKTVETIRTVGGEDYFFGTGDASLNRQGIEFITMPAKLAEHRKRFKKILDALKNDTHWKNEVLGTDQGRAGFHIHIDRRAFTDLHLGKFVFFINSMVNRKFIKLLAQRTDSSIEHYCRFRDVKDLKGGEGNLTGRGLAYNGEKMYAVNLTKSSTVELRILGGAHTELEILKNFDFVHSLVMFTRSVHRFKMTSGDYMAWLSKNEGKYPYICKWLRNQYNGVTTTKECIDKMAAGGVITKATTAEELKAKVAEEAEKLKQQRAALAERVKKQRDLHANLSSMLDDIAATF